MTGDVTGTAWVGIVPPGAAEVVCLFKDDKVTVPLLLHPDGHADAGEASAKDGNLSVGCCLGIRSGAMQLDWHEGISNTAADEPRLRTAANGAEPPQYRRSLEE